ncbi:hypothetical protein PoB_006356200 [Plakobranchus ocellatus]|uniref:Uncharacterized protein n=1 Tax=Plakobranchus ocellatus TaxID=259542 RepID=A0AAV4CYN5_9GAST|nr:hypothetical protein PoB_006356200 [Plakobranchus ocellatus]
MKAEDIDASDINSETEKLQSSPFLLSSNSEPMDIDLKLLKAIKQDPHDAELCQSDSLSNITSEPACLESWTLGSLKLELEEVDIESLDLRPQDGLCQSENGDASSEQELSSSLNILQSGIKPKRITAGNHRGLAQNLGIRNGCVSSASRKPKTDWRQKTRETNPEKYAAYLEKQKAWNRQSRQRKKENWLNGPRTSAMVMERERQRAMDRQRQERYRERRKAENPHRSQKAGAGDAVVRKSVKAMTPAEYREHRRMLVQRCRSKMSAQEKAAVREKDRLYRQNRRLLQEKEACTQEKRQEKDKKRLKEKRVKDRRESPATFDVHLEEQEDFGHKVKQEKNEEEHRETDRRKRTRESSPKKYALHLESEKQEVFSHQVKQEKNDKEQRETDWRKRIRETNPEKYAAHLEKQKAWNRQSRQRKKENWLNGPRTSTMVMERERQQAMARQRQERYRERRLAESTGNSHRSQRAAARDAVVRKSVKAMTPAEYREHRRMLVQRCRSKMSEQQKAAVREKDRLYRQNRKLSGKKNHACAVQDADGRLVLVTLNKWEIQACMTPVNQDTNLIYCASLCLLLKSIEAFHPGYAELCRGESSSWSPQECKIPNLLSFLIFEHLVTTGKFEGKRSRGRQKEKIMDGLATWLGKGKVSDTLAAVKDRDLWRDMIANAYKQGT